MLCTVHGWGLEDVSGVSEKHGASVVWCGEVTVGEVPVPLPGAGHAY